MKREIAVTITLIIGLLCGIFIPQLTLVRHILVGTCISEIILLLIITLCFISDRINKWFN